MSLFDSASLVVTPNGYKEDKLYSIKPTDGSGDLVVTRATTATRVNSAGLVELVPYNLLLNSLAFAANYSYNQCSITSSQVAPDGTNNAKRITNGSTATDSYFEQSISFTPNTYTWSIFVKQGTAATATIKPVHVGLGADVSLMTFTFATETITSIGSISSNGFEKLANGWYRIFCSVVIPSSVSSLRGRFGNPNVANVYNDWAFPQLVTGSSAKEYFPTTDRLNVPRLDYTNSTCPSILVEPQRTNLLSYSEQFDNVSWIKSNSSITANATTAPDGTLTADKLVENSSNANHLVQKAVVASNAVYTFSVFAKKSERNWVVLRGVNASFQNVKAWFNIDAGTIGTLENGATAKITNVGNGWYKLEMTIPSFSTGFEFRVSTSTGNNVDSYTGDGTSGLFIWGAQLEAGSYATSYIPTVASSVTRNADFISKTGISSLIGQTEGVMYFDLKSIANNDFKRLSINGGSYVNSIFFDFDNSNNLYLKVFNGGSAVATLLASGVNIANRNKIAIAYKNNDFSFYVNGTQVASQSSGSVPSGLANYEFSLGGNEKFIGNINASALWKTRLSNTELATLTTI